MTYSILHRLITVSLVFLLTTLGALAADITVDSNCSLTDAIQAAESDSEIGNCTSGDGADNIHLSGDITLAAELPQITTDITIEGGGFTISGGDSFRIFHIADGGSLAINELTLSNGNAEEGGAINNEGVLKVNESNFSDNTAKYFGGAIMNPGKLNISDTKFDRNRADLNGGAIASDGTLVIINSSFSHNSTELTSGGAIGNYGPAIITSSSFSGNTASFSGGAISNINDTMTIVGSKFANNSAEGSGGGGAIFNGAGQLSVADSSFARNLAERDGGAIKNYGDRDYPNAQLSITGSTFAGNIARLTSGGAISSNDYGSVDILNSSFTNNQANLFGGAVSSFGDLRVANSTFASNLAESRAGAIFVFSAGAPTFAHLTVANNLSKEGGGIFVRYKDTALNLYNSIIFGNDGGDCGGQLNQNSGNFIADGSCNPAISGDPLLGALVEHEDGSPAYFPLLPESPAIDAADPEHCTATDQIGRPRPQGNGCDIGAVEFKGE